MTGKERAYLRGLSNGLDTILTVGKGGITENVIKQADEALRARELVKGRVLETSLLSAREAAEAIGEAAEAEVVQTIGSRFVLFRRNPEEPKILFPRR